MKTIQYFSVDKLEHGRQLTTDQVLRFLDDFRRLHSHKPAPSKLISMKVPEDLLHTFKTKAQLSNTPYQTQIKSLMRAWILDQD